LHLPRSQRKGSLERGERLRRGVRSLWAPPIAVFLGLCRFGHDNATPRWAPNNRAVFGLPPLDTASDGLSYRRLSVIAGG